MRTVLLLFAGALAIAACGADDPAGPEANPGPTETTPSEPTDTTTDPTTTAPTSTAATDGPPSALDLDDPAYLYDQDRLHTFELTLTDEALAQIDRNPSAEEWVLGSLTFEGETIDRVAIRYKGSIGAWVGCLSAPEWSNPSGHKTCTKLSMKVKVNWDDSNREFHGVRRLQFHSMNLDPSQMHERLGYWLFREMGVPAPRSVHARLVVNGEYLGVFALTEHIDGQFTRQVFDDGTGNLYKEAWPFTDKGDVTPEQVFVDALRTNEDDGIAPDMIRGFAEDLAAAGPAGAADVVDRWMDVDEIVSWAVVDRTIRNDDGPFHWYCFDDCNNHNYFWYEEPTAGTVHMIPWDLDNSFQNIADDSNPVTPVADTWGGITADCEVFPYGPWSLPQRSAACDPVFAAWAGFDTEYRQRLDEFLDGPFAVSRADAMVKVWSEQIADATAEAADAHEDAVSTRQWERAVDALLADLDHARTVAD